MRIQHNIAALNSYRQLGTNNSNVAKNLEKLSSGYRINKAGDDAAGLSISEKMRSQITGLETAQKNAQDGISLIQTAEGNLQEVHSMLNRMVELATQSSNGTYSEFNRQQLQKEIDSLNSEVDRIASSANFNGLKLLDGSLGGGGTTGAAGAASVDVDALFGDKLKDVAAGKYEATFAAAGVKVDNNKTGEFSFTYSDEAGATKTIKIEVKTAGSSAAAQYRVDGGDWKTATQKTGTGAAGLIANDTASLLRDALGDTELANTFDIGGTAADIKLTAKNAGATGARFISGTTHADASAGNATTVGPTAVTAGTDQFHELDLAAFKTYDGTDTTAQNIFEVNGKKFAFVANGADTTKYSPDITTVALSTGGGVSPIAADVTAMVSKINDAFGKGTAEASTTKINFKPNAGTTIASGKGLTLQVGDTNEKYQQVTVSVAKMDSKSLGINGIDISQQGGAQSAIDAINKAIDSVSSTRGDLGALQNRLDHTISNIGVATENMTAAESRIRDTDMAQEMMDFTKNNILTQAAQAMLAQANTIPQSVLQLLQ